MVSTSASSGCPARGSDGSAFDNVGSDLLGAEQAIIDGQMHGADGRRFGYPDGPLDGLRQALRIDHAPVGLGKRRGDGRRAKIVADVEADLVGEAARIAGKGDDHDGQAAGPHVDQLSQALRQTGAEMHHRDRHVASGLRVAAPPWP